MYPGEVKFLDWLVPAQGAPLVFSGWRTTSKRSTKTCLGEHKEKNAARLGWFWLGLLILLAARINIPFLKSSQRIFLESDL
jgi:hypothetical protein